MITWVSERRQAFVAVAMLGLVALALWTLSAMVREVSYGQVLDALWATPDWRIAAAVGCTGLSFATLTFYDLNAFRAIGQPRPWRDIAPAAFVAYAVGQTAGFGPLSGGAVRLRFYTPLGLSPGEVARIVAFVTLSFGLGLAAVGAAAVLLGAGAVAAQVGFSPAGLQTGAVLVLAALTALLALAGRGVVLPVVGVLRLPPPALMLRQLAVTGFDVMATAAVLWVLLPGGSVGFGTFLPVFAVALALGVLSHVPAGLGVFEAVILAALDGAVPHAEVLGALALYRVIYHALPLGIAALGLVGAELARAGRREALAPARRALAALAPQVLAGLALVLGAMLVFSAVTPARDDDLVWLAGFIPLPILEGAHFLASLVGVGLMLTGRGLAYRLDGAWLAALVAAGLGIGFSLVKADAIYESALLAAFAGALWVMRAEFDRPASLLNGGPTARWIGAVLLVLASAVAVLVFVYDIPSLRDESWWRFELSGEAPRGLRALLGAVIVTGAVAVWSLLRPVPVELAPPGPDEIARAVAIVRAQSEPGANLVRMGDKRLMFSADGRGFLMYGRQGRSWIALYDPVGPREVWPELVWRFVETARQAGGRAAFYQVGPEHLSVYADAGLSAHKLGEQARVDLAAFTLQGGKRYGQRQVLARGPRDGLSVEILPPDGVAAVLPQVAAVSAQWLKSRGGREKAFSLGAFAPDYVCQTPMALLRRDGKIIAFATLLVTDLGHEVSIDLMRHTDALPNGGMEFLFLRLIEIYKAQGVRWFDLGMAPLAGLSDSEAAPVWQQIGRAVFEQSSKYYNFKGLRAFKARFLPEWRPRYLAVAAGRSPALALIDATRLIGAGLEEGR